SWADSVDWDNLGNSYAYIKGTADSDFSVVIEGHIDEIGFIVTHIDDNGMIWFDRIGGWDDQVIVGQRIWISGPEGEVAGVIGKKAAHPLPPGESEKPAKVQGVSVRNGAENKDGALAQVRFGPFGGIPGWAGALPAHLWASRSMDNRT